MERAPTSDERKRMRTGFTTGACAAAAAKAATRCLVRLIFLSEIETTLPNRMRVTFPLKRCELAPPQAICSVIKDAGDDPDCTHGAELVATVQLKGEPGVEIRGGEGVATVTKPGLGLEVGAPAVNPVPRRNITEMVEEELDPTAATDVTDAPSDLRARNRGAIVTISVPGGEEMAKETLNARLGLVGGISILGTTGIVRPYSTAAFKASIVQSIDVAFERGHRVLVVTTGGKSEAYAMKLHPEIAEEAFIQMGDFWGATLKHSARRGMPRLIVVGMIGKLSKMADGKLQTHAAGSEVNHQMLAELAAGLGAPLELQEGIRAANTARHVLELCAAHGLVGITSEICRRVVEVGTRHVAGQLDLAVELVDFSGALLGRYPREESAATRGKPS